MFDFVKDKLGFWVCRYVIKMPRRALLRPDYRVWPFFNEISSVHEEKVRCVSVHLASSVHLDALYFEIDKVAPGFCYFMLVTHLENLCIEQYAHQNKFYFITIIMMPGKYSN